jgi:hypothetical protein
MRRLFILSTVLATALLLPAAAAATSLAPLHASGHVSATVQGVRAASRVDRAPLRYVPLARTLTGTGTISLHIYQFDASPEVNAEADWLVVEGADVGAGHGYTDASGDVALTGVPAATSGNGEIAVFVDSPDNGMYDLWNLTWDAGGTNIGLAPGHLPMIIHRSSDRNWNYWTQARVSLYAGTSDETHMASTTITRTGAYTTANARTITTGPETLDAGTIYYSMDEGMELPVSGTAVAGNTTASPALEVREADAQRVWMDYWGSGKPGTKTLLVLNNFRAHWTNKIIGGADWPDSAPIKSFGSKTSGGGKYEIKNVTIPSGAAPGYKYWIWVDHTAGAQLSLLTSFQTCTLKASKATIHPGGPVKLSGVIPTQGHRGSTRGKIKRVIIYKTTKNTGQPNSWAPSRAIWTKVATVKANGLGKFTSRSLMPTQTTSYVVRYPGDAWYWGAFTSLCKVTVR